MSTQHRNAMETRTWLAIALLGLPALGLGQAPVDDNGEPYSEYSTAGTADGVGGNGIPLLSSTELEELIGPIALYPDDLLAIVLPASTYPLQVVQAGRFLEELEGDPSLEPEETWDDSVVALLNYPEVVELLNEDLDWTWRLGEAVVAQQDDVIAAVEAFRDRAYAAGNLKSDSHQTVSQTGEGIIEIVPVDDEIIYVPYYEPEHVVVYQPRPVYYYYPRPYPVYYYPYPSGYHFDRGFFWGVTTAFTIGWYTDRLHVFHHSYRGHPYYGRHYYDRWWYRRPSINIYNNYYVHNHVRRSHDYHRSGDYWRSREYRRLRSHDRRITRNRYYSGDGDNVRRHSTTKTRSSTTQVERDFRHKRFADHRAERSGDRQYGTARKTHATANTRNRDRSVRQSTQNSTRHDKRDKIEFRDRSRDQAHKSRQTPTTVRHGFVDGKRKETQANRTRKLEPRERQAGGRVSRHTARVTRPEPRRHQVVKPERAVKQPPTVHESARKQVSRKQTAKVERYAQQRSAAPREASRRGKTERKADRSQRRPDRRKEARSK